MSERHQPAEERRGRGSRALSLLLLALLVATLAVPAGVLGSEPSRNANDPTPGPTVAASSIRPRGPEAPLAPTPSPTPAATTTPTPGPSPAKQASATSSQREPVDEDVRVWPLKAGTFAFTQAFGCVDQIANFYSAAAGCPASHPVFHSGIDLAAPLGTTIYAAAAGWVTHAGPDRETGLANSQIIIQHVGANDGYATEYLHWRASYVKEGDFVRAGQPIAEVGSVGYSTGPHLHFSVIEFKTGDRIDPIGWLPKQSGSGIHLGLAPDAKRYPIAERGRSVPDYADPAPPPAPKRERVPRHAPKAAADSGDAAANADGKAKGGHHKNAKEKHAARAGKQAKADGSAATATPAAGSNRKQRRDRRAAKATATPAPDTTPAAKQRHQDRAATDPTPAAEPTAAWVNAYVPPVPARPSPLIPGAVAPTPTSAPEPAKPKHDKSDKTRKRDASGDTSSGKQKSETRTKDKQSRRASGG